MHIVRAREQAARLAGGVAGWVLARPVPVLAALAAAYVVVVNGVWLVPNIDNHWEISRDLRVNPFVGRGAMDWSLSSYLLPAIANLLGLNGSITAFALAAALVLGVGFAASVAALRGRFGDDAARAALLAFCCLPIGNDLVTFLGTSDGLVWSLSTLLVAFRGPAQRVVLAALLTTSHREQAACILAALTLVLPLIEDDRPFWRTLAALWAGFAAGAAVLALHFWANGFVITANRVDAAFGIGLLRLAINPLRQPTMTAVSLFAVFWPAVILMLAGLWQADRAAVLRVLLALGGALAAMMVTIDQTRVFALLSWPVILVLVVRAMRDADDRAVVLRLSVLLTAVGLLLPRPMLWDGHVHSTALLATIGFVSDSLGATNVLGGLNYPRLAPFRLRW